MTQPNFFERANNWIRSSVTIRLITIGILILLMLIPIFMIQDLIRERERNQESATYEVSRMWGESQTLHGLVLTVPYLTTEKVYDNTERSTFHYEKRTEYAHFLPDKLQINGQVKSQIRYRGIYEVVLYNSELQVDGVIKRPDFTDWNIPKESILWEDAFVSIGLSDLRSIQEGVTVNWNGKPHSFNPGMPTNDVFYSGISCRVPVSTDQDKYTFNVSLNFNGSSNLSFIPLGKTTDITVRSDWPNPSFVGSFLPDERQISDSGFTANWKVLHLNRSYPQQFTGHRSDISESHFGVDLIVTLDEYQKSMRAAKYAVMFITLTFLVFFFVQVLNGVRIHPIQYIMVGLALCIFYTLLIALSEHIPFAWSYLMAAVAVVGLITIYARSVFKKGKLTLVILGILVLLYGFIFSIIQMEDYALLMGSIGLFISLATAMYLSRKVNWYELRSRGESDTA